MSFFIGLGVFIVCLALAEYIENQGEAVRIVAEAEADAIRRKADHDFGKDTEDTQ